LLDLRMKLLNLAGSAALVLLAASCAPSSHPPASAAAPAQSAGYQLVWADEFDRDGRPDPANWTYESGFVRNQELQWYQPENARVENGLLIIEARRERRPNPLYGTEGGTWRPSASTSSTPPRA
jgi:beta-glucanase (GH16 family)